MASSPTPPASRPAPRPIRRWGIGFNVLFQVILTLALFLLVNYLSYTHYLRRDLTPGHDYTLSESSENFIHKLNKDVRITLICSGSSDTMKNARILVEEYRRAKHTRIHVEDIDPLRDIEQAEQLKLQSGLTLRENGILVSANDHTRFIPEDELLIKGAEGGRENPTMDFRGEDAITSAILGLMEGASRKVYFVVGKGSPGNRAESLMTLANLGKQQNFDTMMLNITDVSAIPPNADALVLAGPRYDFSEQEMNLLRGYWETKRSSLLVMLDPNGETPRLAQFLTENGVIPRADRVLCAESTATGPSKDFSVQSVFLEDSPISKPFISVASRLSGQTQSLDLRENSEALRARHIVVTPLMNASNRYWGETRYLDALPVIGPEDAQPPVQLAASVERGFVADERLRVDSSRMVVIGNAEMLDPATRLAVHQDFISSCLNWMLNRERLIGITPKRLSLFRLDLTEEQHKKIFRVTAVLLPGVALALGMLMWSHRRW
jgi:gliding motility-associatede transport system auxiliary component